MSVYVSQATVDAALDDLDAHTRGTPSGYCATCGELEPCATRAAAHALLFRAGGILPRRTPGHAGTHWLVAKHVPAHARS